MRIETVDQLVAHLKAEGVRFEVLRTIATHDVIRAESRFTACGGRCCPLVAALPEHERTSNAAAGLKAQRLLGMSAAVASQVITAADAAPHYDPAVRAKLLTLVEA